MGIYFPFIFFSIVLVIKWSDVWGVRWVGDGIIAVRLIALVCQDISPAYAPGQFLQFGSVWYLYSSTGSVFLISESHRLARTTRPSNIPSPTCLIHFMSYFVFNSTPFIETILPLQPKPGAPANPFYPIGSPVLALHSSAKRTGRPHAFLYGVGGKKVWQPRERLRLRWKGG